MKMSFSGFWDWNEGDTDEYAYSAGEMSSVLSGLTADGVNAHFGDCFATTVNGLVLTVGTGECWIGGRCGYNNEAITLTLDAGTRKDTLAAHIDTTNRLMEIVIVKGTSSDYPTLDSTYLPLFNVAVSSSSATVTDARTYSQSATQIIYSATTPAVINGAVWLKPLA